MEFNSNESMSGLNTNTDYTEEQNSFDEPSSTNKRSNEIASTEFFQFAGYLSPILNLESPSEMSTIMKKRATQKMNDKEVNSETVPQDLPPQMKFVPLTSNHASPNSESNFVLKKTGLSPPTSAEGSVVTFRKMLFSDEENKGEMKEERLNTIFEGKDGVDNEVNSGKLDQPILNYGGTFKLTIKQDNGGPKIIDHNASADTNNSDIDKSEKKMIMAMMQRYLDEQNLVLDSTEARSVSHNQNNNHQIYKNPLQEYSTTFTNDLLGNERLNPYQTTFRMENRLPEFDLKPSDKTLSQNNKEGNFHLTYQMPNMRLRFDSPSQNNNSMAYYENYQHNMSSYDQFPKPQSYVPGGVESKTPELIACKSQNSPTEMSDEVDRICHCKKSKCLKLYCECFSASIMCNRSCSCNSCMNNEANVETRQKAISSILARNSMAFKNKMSKAEKRVAMLTTSNSESTTSRGCNCRKSLCLKKYCECFFTNKLCNPIICRCIDCNNFEGSSKLFYAIRKKDESDRKDFESGKKREIVRYQITTATTSEPPQSYCNLEAHLDSKRFKSSNDEYISNSSEMNNSYDTNFNNGLMQLEAKPSFGGSERDNAEEVTDPQESVMV